MSDSAFDHLLEFALREVLRDAGRPSVAHEPRGASMRGRWRRRLRVVAAAAAILVVVAIAAWPVRDDAVADRALRVTDATDTFRSTRDVPFGAVGWNHDATAVELTTRAGSRLRLLRDAAVRFGDPIDLLGGELELLPSARPRVVRTAAGSIESPPNSHVFVRSNPFPLPDSEETPMKLPDLLARSRQVPFTLSITVLLGSAELVDAQERTRVVAGETRNVQPRDDARRDAARASTLFVATNRDLPEPADEQSMLQWKDLDEQHGELGICLLRSPAAVAAVKNDLLTALSKAGVPDVRRGRLLQLADLTEEVALHDAGAALVGKQPNAFTFEHWIALAARGNAAGRTELHRFLQEPRGALGARVVAALVLGGDASRRDGLEEFVAVPMDEAIDDFQKFDARCLAVLALAHLGDPAPRTTFVKDLAGAVAERLDSPQAIAASADFVRRATFFLGQPNPRVDNLDLRLRAFVVPALGAGDDAAAVRKAVTDLEIRVAAIASTTTR